MKKCSTFLAIKEKQIKTAAEGSKQKSDMMWFIFLEASLVT
jgi:hypothetical protein